MEERTRISAAVREHFDRQVAFLQRMVRTRSTNPFTPDLSPPDAPVEEGVAALILDELQRLGLQGSPYGVSAQRPNIVCRLPGTDPTGKMLILNTHMDTVEPSRDYKRDPFGGQIEQGRLYGVGAADAKAQIAAFIYAVHALREIGVSLKGCLTLAFVVDEESGACSPFGTQYLLEQGLLRGNAALVGEPGNCKIAIGHRGVYRFRVQTYGEAVHTGLREWEEGTRGRNAILEMARLAIALSRCPLPHVPSPAFPGRKPVLTFPTLIQGGNAVNIVPGQCEAYGDVRLLPGTSGDEIRRRLIDCLDRASIASYRLDTVSFVPAVEIPERAEIVECLSSSVEAVTGRRLRREGSGPTCDGWMFIARGIPAVCGYGVACGGVHGADEWVDVESLRQVTEVYAHTIFNYLEPSQV